MQAEKQNPFQGQATKENVERLMRSLDEAQAAKVRELLQDGEKLRALLSSPAAEKLKERFGEKE